MPTVLQPGSIVTLQLPAELVPTLLAAIEELPIKKGGKLYELFVRQIEHTARKQGADALKDALKGAAPLAGEETTMAGPPPKLNEG